MRIVCPNCTSQYEVSEEAIPETGRDVQCAKCSEIWFQERPMRLSANDQPLTLDEPDQQDASETPQSDQQTDGSSAEPTSMFRSRRTERSTPIQRRHKPEPEPQPEPPVSERPRPEIDPEVQRILREEAEFAANSPAKVHEAPVEEEAPAEPEVIQETPQPELAEKTAETMDNILPDEEDTVVEPEQSAPEPTTDETEVRPSTEYVQPAPPYAAHDGQEVAPQIDADGISRVIHELDDAEQRQMAERAKTSVTLASAKSLREILEAEAIDPSKAASTPTPNETVTDDASDLIDQSVADALDATDAESVTTGQPPLDAEVYLGDLGKRPIQIHREDPVSEPEPTEEEQDDDKGPVFVSASRPLIRPASDLIKSASSMIKGSGSDKRANLTDEDATDDVNDTDDATADVETDNKDIKLAPTSQAKSARAAFTDIDDINASLDLDKDDDEDDDTDDIDLDDLDLTERTSRFSMGFLAACGVAVITTLMYMFAPNIADKIPATGKFMASYEASVDSGRMVLQDMYYQGGEPGFGTLFQNAKDKFTN